MEALHGQINAEGDLNFSAAVVGENPDALAGFEAGCMDHLQTVRDSELRAKLTPNYKVGCKRLVLSDNFYEAIQRDKAEVITEPIV